MRGVVFESAGATPKVVDNLEKPSPSSDQVLVKSLYTAINPVDGFMANLGLLVVDWPLVLGVDASGVIVEAGENAQSKYGLKKGDYVCGCTRLGSKGYSTGQEFYLMDANVTIPKPKNIDTKQAATIGVGAQTACLALYEGLHLEMPKVGADPSKKDEWVMVMGGASSVGRSAVQLALASGYKVIAAVSNKSASACESLGASTFDYKKSIDDQVKRVMEVTGGEVYHIFDATAQDNPEVAKTVFKAMGSSKPKYFSTTNDWSGVTDFEGGKTYEVKLGSIGRPGADKLNEALESYTPLIVGLIEHGKFVTAEYELIGDGGFEDAIKAYAHQAQGAGGSKKVIVKIGDE